MGLLQVEWLTTWTLGQQGVDVRGADKIIQRESGDGMRGIYNLDAVVTDFQIRMMILLVRHPGYRIDECHGLVIIFKVKLAVYRGMTRCQ